MMWRSPARELPFSRKNYLSRAVLADEHDVVWIVLDPLTAQFLQ